MRVLSDCDRSRARYTEFTIREVSVGRTVGGKGSDRKKVSEILVLGGKV